MCSLRWLKILYNRITTSDFIKMNLKQLISTRIYKDSGMCVKKLAKRHQGSHFNPSSYTICRGYRSAGKHEEIISQLANFHSSDNGATLNKNKSSRRLKVAS